MFGTRPRPNPYHTPIEGVTPYEAAVETCADIACPRTGWTPAHIFPRWVADLCWLAGVALRKFWLYVCAPAGALTLTIALLASRL